MNLNSMIRIMRNEFLQVGADVLYIDDFLHDVNSLLCDRFYYIDELNGLTELFHKHIFYQTKWTVDEIYKATF